MYAGKVTPLAYGSKPYRPPNPSTFKTVIISPALEEKT
jgi:hypothetical protein